ncbi:MAG: AAA family ATPase [Lentisphaeraceae bacterium]|nr:AAA family ATPase [Lentisphaeraceae bacterium]
MIVSLILRGFKYYRGTNYIPISESFSNFVSFIGENGVGKSSVLESFDCYFNDLKDWNVNKFTLKDGVGEKNRPFIMPCFLIKKDKFLQSTDKEKEHFKNLEILSKFFWSLKSSDIKGRNTDIFNSILKVRDRVSSSVTSDTHLFFGIGLQYKSRDLSYGSLDNLIRSQLSDELFSIDLYKYVISQFNFIYIPAEINAEEYTKIESTQMQKLMNKDLIEEINSLITNKSILDINKKLKIFTDDITEGLEGYTYKKPSAGKSSFTKVDLIEKILTEFFSIRVLNRQVQGHDIAISDLSSGQKRKALFDLVYYFLTEKNQKNKLNTILAIDEPELSLHVSACLSQFEKLGEISSNNIQVVITTHWYGYLPLMMRGEVHYTYLNDAEEVAFDSYEMSNYRSEIESRKKETRGNLPSDYKLKSTNDLIQSIVASCMDGSEYNWIVCEGISEKIYFEAYFKDEIKSKKLKILPVKGFKGVKKIYEMLKQPFNDSDLSIKGSVVCLIDTDDKAINGLSIDKINNLFFKRMIFSGNKIKLVNADQTQWTPPTEIEDSLSSDAFYDTLKSILDSGSASDQIFSDFAFDSFQRFVEESEIQITSKVSYDVFDFRQSEKALMKEFFDCQEGYMKVHFANQYVSQLDVEEYEVPCWLNEIKKFLSLN